MLREHTLPDGRGLPALGVGLYKVPPGDVASVVDASLEAGLRLFDTATMYENEAALGQALAASGTDDVFVTTKILNSDHGRHRAVDAGRRSRDLLGVEVIDLCLIHWPAPRQNRYVETWEALLQLQQEGVVRNVGVSNFHVHHLDRLAAAGLAQPAVNQVECHPWLPQRELHDVHRTRGIVTQAWSPLARGRVLEEPALIEIAEAHGVDVAEVVLAWLRSRGIGAVVKSTHPDRIRRNAQSLELELADEDMRAIARLESGIRTGMDPDDRE